MLYINTCLIIIIINYIARVINKKKKTQKKNSDARYSDAYFMDISAAHANATSRLKDNNMNGRRRDGRSERGYPQPLMCTYYVCA